MSMDIIAITRLFGVFQRKSFWIIVITALIAYFAYQKQGDKILPAGLKEKIIFVKEKFEKLKK